ncbi:hypothetical protein OIO90_002489 [Microbotryomycetes sp. JL221]|nr:hypothetical protein OIO90_002489 [Microbotryomycetes sp. JL221]
MTNSPTAVHTHSPALLRAAISNINERNVASHAVSTAERDATSRPDVPTPIAPEWQDNVVVSHPPSPRSVPAEFRHTNSSEPSHTIQALEAIRPLDPSTLRRIPLSTPPRTPPPPLALKRDQAGSTASNGSPIADGGLSAAEAALGAELNFPLILVTGKSCRCPQANPAFKADESIASCIHRTGGSGFIGSHTVLEILQQGQ